ncbi:MAG: response regulator [Pseudomonadota bacterium]
MTKKIIVADDSLFARMLVKEAVSQIYVEADYIEVPSGQEVLNQQAEADDIDWFLLDVNMGEPNGYETAKQLAEKGVDMNKITLITGNKSSELQSKADEIGLNYINKAMSPADVDDFVERLQNFFNH